MDAFKAADKKVIIRIQRMIRRFELSVRLDEMKGMYRPEEWDEISEQFKKEKKRLIEKVYHETKYLYKSKTTRPQGNTSHRSSGTR